MMRTEGADTLIHAMFVLAWIVLIGAPPAAMGMMSVAHLRWPRASIVAAGVSAATLLLTLGLARLGLRLATPAGDAAWLLACYAAYAVLAASCLGITNRLLRAVLLALAALPIAGAYLLATFGSLGLMFIVADMTAPPAATEEMAGGLTCESTWWGMAATDSGYALHLSQTWKWFPFVRREVDIISVNQNANDREESCAGVFLAYTKASR